MRARTITYTQARPRAGAYVGAYAAGLSGKRMSQSFTAGEQRSFWDGVKVRVRIVRRRLAKKWAARIVREYNRRCKRDNDRFTQQSGEYVARAERAWAKQWHWIGSRGTRAEESELTAAGWLYAPSGGWMRPTPDDKFDGQFLDVAEALSELRGLTGT